MDDISDLELSKILDEQEDIQANGSRFTFESRKEQMETDESPKSNHLKILKKYFGHTNFRPLQWKIINSILKDKRDNFTIMSTGYGKSLCYQYPAVFSGEITLVVSPLISLMEDQVMSLNFSNIPACLLGSAQKEKDKVISDIFKKKYSIIYLTPEFVCGDYGRGILLDMKKLLNICLIAIDEAHCISSWGHDFRYQYRSLGKIRDILTNIPVLAVTATATRKVQDDIINSLRLRNPQILHSGFDRPNLYIEVCPKGQSGLFFDFNKVMNRVKDEWKFPGPTIIYCLTRKITETVEEFLKSKDINCAVYHAGKSLNQRKEVHERFLKDQVDVIVATTAFGMGIDKPDVRCVVHYGAPSSIEGYYQEIGRAGRDGEKSRCITFHHDSDFATHQFIAGQSKSYGNETRTDERSVNMRKFLVSTDCRRKYLLAYFGEEYSSENPTCCDNCHRKKSGTDHEYEGLDENGNFDFTEDARKMLQSIDLFDGRFGLTTYIQFIRGLKNDKYTRKREHPLFGSGKKKNENWWKALTNLLLQERYVTKKPLSMNGFMCHVFQVSDKGSKLLESLTTGSGKLVLKPPSDILSQLKLKPQRASASTSNNNNKDRTSNAPVLQNKEDEIDNKLYSLLVERRNKIAEERECMPHAVISIPDIKELIRVKPRTLQQLSSCSFQMFSEIKINLFGQELIKIILDELGTAENETKPSIEEVLCENPIRNKFGDSARESYNMLKTGLSVEKIAKERSLANSTVNGHLTEAMLTGLPITLAELGVDEFARVLITKCILECPGGKMTDIKETCTSEITYDQIRVVSTYKKIRDHLEKERLAYAEFENFSYESLIKEASALNLQGILASDVSNKDEHIEKPKARMDQHQESSTTINGKPEELSKEDHDLEEFLKLCNDIIKDEEDKIEEMGSDRCEKQQRGEKRKNNFVVDGEKEKSSGDVESVKVKENPKEGGFSAEMYDDEVFGSPPRSEYAVGDSKPLKIPKKM